MKKEICLDANIFITYLCHEEGYSVCQQLFERLEMNEFTFFEPAMVLFEVSSVLQKKVLRKELTLKQHEQAYDFFLQFPLLLQWQDYLLRKSMSFASQLKLKNTYDMSYLAVAEHRHIPCVTMDQEFYKKAKKIYSNIHLASDFLNKLH